MTLFIDELEMHMHPHLTKHFIQFAREEGVQLIYATHDTTLLDHDLLRRDQIYLIEKDEGGRTHLFSLSSYKNVRKSEAFQKGYLAGRYGAVPVLNRFGANE